MCLIIVFGIWVLAEIIPDIAESSLKMQVEIRSKIEYIHKLLRYQLYFESDEKNFDLFPTADKDNTELYMNEGYHLVCFLFIFLNLFNIILLI